MESKRQGIVPFIACKCPKCGKGKVFKNSIFSTKFAETNYNCTVCEMSYEPEPGFFYGAMYFSYALIVGFIIMGKNDAYRCERLGEFGDHCGGVAVSNNEVGV